GTTAHAPDRIVLKRTGVSLSGINRLELRSFVRRHSTFKPPANVTAGCWKSAWNQAKWSEINRRKGEWHHEHHPTRRNTHDRSLRGDIRLRDRPGLRTAQATLSLHHLRQSHAPPGRAGWGLEYGDPRQRARLERPLRGAPRVHGTGTLLCL